MARSAAVAEAYDEPPSSAPGVEQDQRAIRHSVAAREALALSEPPHVAITHAILALEARVEELTVYVAQLG